MAEKISFRTHYKDGDELVMKVPDKNVEEIRLCVKSRNIYIVTEDHSAYTLEDIDQMSWQRLKQLVTEFNGVWTNKKDAINFLIGQEKR